MSKGSLSDECGTPGCDNIGMGISIAVSRPSIYRCSACLDCINALAPAWTRGMTDEDAYERRNRAIGRMDAETLHREAAPILARITTARDAYATLADLIGATVARDAVTAIVNAGDRVIDVTVTNWWAAYRWPEHHRATAPEPQPFTFTQAWPVTIKGLGIGTVQRTMDGLNERYIARDLTGGSIRPDGPAPEEPTYDTPHQAARALAAWAARMGWDQDR
ncbi:hypothetical protein [Amycolatopsis pigmentata]|uniref:Uncharacterized protein n=1 Tax=Amycolatopsis pigmentata TaxID=450801 RepID=A0ABW5G6Y5_9PSEU